VCEVGVCLGVGVSVVRGSVSSVDAVF
jgi:hypothetical protein